MASTFAEPAVRHATARDPLIRLTGVEKVYCTGKLTYAALRYA